MKVDNSVDVRNVHPQNNNLSYKFLYLTKDSLIEILSTLIELKSSE